MPGQFNSCTSNQPDCAPFAFGESFAGWPWLLSCAANEGEGGAADICERSWGRSGSYPAGVLTEGNVAHMEQAVLDGPMIAGELQKSSRVELGRRQAGDGVNNLPRAVCFHFATAFDSTNRCKAWPFFIKAGGEFGAHRDPARFDPAVIFFNGLCAFEIRGITPPGGNARNGGDHRRRGKYRRTLWRARIAVPADWL